VKIVTLRSHADISESLRLHYRFSRVRSQQTNVVIANTFSGSRYDGLCLPALDLLLLFLLLPVDEGLGLVSTGTLSRTISAKQAVPPVEERAEVGQGTLMMHIVLDRTTPERRPTVR